MSCRSCSSRFSSRCVACCLSVLLFVPGVLTVCLVSFFRFVLNRLLCGFLCLFLSRFVFCLSIGACFFVSSCRVVMCVSFSFVMCFLFFVLVRRVRPFLFFSSCRALRYFVGVCPGSCFAFFVFMSMFLRCAFVISCLRIFCFVCFVLVPYFCPCGAL